MEKQNVIYPYNEILFRHKKELSVLAITWMILENIKFNKSNTKGHILCTVVPRFSTISVDEHFGL